MANAISDLALVSAATWDWDFTEGEERSTEELASPWPSPLELLILKEEKEKEEQEISAFHSYACSACFRDEDGVYVWRKQEQDTPFNTFQNLKMTWNADKYNFNYPPNQDVEFPNPNPLKKFTTIKPDFQSHGKRGRKPRRLKNRRETIRRPKK